MNTVNLSEIASSAQEFEDNIADVETYLSENSAGIDFAGQGLPDPSNAQVIGVYGGTAPGVTWGGAELQVIHAYDRTTGETGTYLYAGGTAGPSTGVLNGQAGAFVFDGPINQIPGFSYGVQGSAGVAVGYTRTPSGYNMVQIGSELGLAVEVTAGWTFDLNGTARVDWALTEQRLGQLYSDAVLRDILVELAQAKALGGAYADEFLAKYGNLVAPANNHCFLHDMSVQMWPLDPSIKPRLDGSYDEELVLSKVWYKRQDQMQAGDIVVSPDKWGRLQPGRVTRTMTNIATHILDFWGTGVTPGHAYNCADGPLKGGFAPIMDILRMDGALMRSDGTMFRSTTNCDVGSMGDMMIHASATLQKRDGTWTEPKSGKMRFGTRIILPDGRDTSLMELAHEEGWKVTDDGYMIGMMKGDDGAVEERAFHFPYRYGAELPKPEDYILKRSAVTLEEIYLANEWEQIGTRMPAPDSLVGFNPNSAMKRIKPKPNVPPAFTDRPDAPIVECSTQRGAQAPASRPEPLMNRRQRKAMAAKQRKVAKVRGRMSV